MIYEFAVFPGLFSGEDRITALRIAFGMDAGRVVSDFPPKQWATVASKVIDASASDSEERKRWIAALMAIVKYASYRRQGAEWDNENPSWIGNAVREHRRRPFRGILYNETSAEAAVIRFGVEMGQHPNWNCVGSCHRPRVARQMIETVAPMLEISTSLVLVDPHFWATDGRWQNVLQGFARFLSQMVVRPQISHIHYITGIDRDVTVTETERQFRSLIEPDLPAGISVGFHLVFPAILHDRFVLTDRGGVQFGRGLDEGIGDVLITRLSAPAYEKEWGNALDIRSGKNPAVRHRFQLHGRR